MIDEQLREYARRTSSASRLRADDVLIHAQRSHRRRLVAGSACSAVALAAVAALVVRPSTVPPPVPAVTEAAPAGCSVTALPLPTGVTGGFVTTADPTGRYVIGSPFPRDDTAPAVTMLWTDGHPQVLPSDFSATAVNASGLVVGFRGRLEARRAAVISGGTVVDLPVPDGGTTTDAVGVNARGEIAGVAFFADSTARGVVWPSSHGKPRLLQAAGGKDTDVAGIADDGTTIGTIGTRERPYRWASDGTGTALALPDGYRGGEGQGIAGDWAIGTASTSRGGEDGKAELTAQNVVVRWNLRTGAVEHGFPIAPTSVSAGGTLAGRVGMEQPGIWRDGAVVALPMPAKHVRGSAQRVVGDGHTVLGWSDGAGGPAPVVWRGC